MRRISLLFLLLAFPVWAQVTGKLERMSLHEKDFVLLGEGRRGPYFLPDSLIIANSEKVLVNHRRLAAGEYTLNYLAGELRFLEPVPQGAEIRLIYQIAPFTVSRTLQRHPLIQRVFGADTSVPGSERPGAAAAEEDLAAQLSKSGSITRGVTVGNNRGLKINSALNINVSGKVADNVEVVAALTDQSTPIQPEGTTQNLQEIDKVFVQLKAPHFAATLGDYTLDYSSGQFARYSRKLQGAMGALNYKNYMVSASGAVSRGKYISQSFMGQEGNQGPYQLKGDRGQIDIIVLAGTERVYLDGEQLVRGETNDYVIDYSAAQVTFTRRRLITADSRLIVDFQYSDEKFRRSIYAAQAATEQWDGRFKLSATFIHEGDDKDNPLDFTLDEEKLAILRAAGDDPQKAVTDGALYVGPGKGRYIKTDAGYFQYASADSGDYSVTFSDVGQGMGDYTYQGAGIYVYAGTALGRYQPVVLLTPARSQSLLNFQLAAQPVKAMQLKGEVAFSENDLNSYSASGDEDNQGVAQDWQLQFAPGLRWGRRSLGTLTMTGRLRQVEDRFQDIDRTTEAEYNRRWDLPGNAARGERVREAQVQYDPFAGLKLSGEYGDIRKDQGFQSTRWQIENLLSRPKWPEYSLRFENISKSNDADSSSGEWRRLRSRIAHSIWRLKPFVDYEGEEKKENWSDSLYTGFRFSNLTSGVEFRPATRITATARQSWRNDDTYVGLNTFAEKSTATTQQLGFRVQQLGALNINMDYTHRERTYADSGSGRQNTDLAEVRLMFNPWKNAVNSEVNYQISNTATATKERVYIKVSPGDGTYRYDEQLKEYVVDPLGDYILRVLTTDELVPVVELKASTRLRLDPSRYWGQKRAKGWMRKWLSAISTESFASIEERTKEKDVWQIYLLNLDKFQQAAATMYGSLLWRQDLFLFENRRAFSLRLRYQNRDEMNNQYLEGGQTRQDEEMSARITARLGTALSSQSELAQKRMERSFAEGSRQDRDILSRQGRFELSYRPQSRLELALESRLAWEQDRFYTPATKVRALAFTPRVVYSWQTKGRWQAEIEWSQVEVSPKERLIPYEMANGRSAGRSMRWDIRFDYKLSQTVQATVSYSGRNEPERQQGVIHTGRAQVTAAFR